MRLKKYVTKSYYVSNPYIIEAFFTFDLPAYWESGLYVKIVGRFLLVRVFWDSGWFSPFGFANFVADHGCVSYPSTRK